MRTVTVNLKEVEAVKKFVQEASASLCKVTAVSADFKVDAKSIMGMFSLNLSKPVEIQFSCEKEEATDEERAAAMDKFEQAIKPYIAA